MQLKGTVLVLVTMIIQIILNIIVFMAWPSIGALLLIDTVLIIFMYIGFKSGKRGWAIAAIVYSILSLLLAVSNGNFFNISILLLIAGILALTDENSV
jgi:hypothetical protein